MWHKNQLTTSEETAIPVLRDKLIGGGGVLEILVSKMTIPCGGSDISSWFYTNILRTPPPTSHPPTQVVPYCCLLTVYLQFKGF